MKTWCMIEPITKLQTVKSNFLYFGFTLVLLARLELKNGGGSAEERAVARRGGSVDTNTNDKAKAEDHVAKSREAAGASRSHHPGSLLRQCCPCFTTTTHHTHATGGAVLAQQNSTLEKDTRFRFLFREGEDEEEQEEEEETTHSTEAITHA